MTLQARNAAIHEAMSVSQEAIAYQGGKSMLFQDLTFAFQNYIAGGVYNQPAMDKLNLSGIVQKHTGLHIEFRIEPGTMNANAIPPIIDPNSPLLDRFRAMGLSDVGQLGDYLITFRKVTAFSKDLSGSIDRANGRVTGVFSKILTSITMGTGLWDQGKLTPEEVAAVCLHEIGHVFTFFECLMQTATLNMVLASANQALAHTTDMNHRLQLVFETQQALGVKVEDQEGLARPGIKSDAFNAVFLKACMDPKLRSAAGSATYDLRSSEFLADQFAARYGAGRALVIGLDKMHTVLGDGHRLPMAAHIVFQAFRTAVYLLSLFVFPITTVVVATLFLIFMPNESHVYDMPAERMARVRNDLVQSLKDTSLPAKVRQQLVQDIEALDKIRQGVEDHRTLMDYVWIALTSKRRGQYAQMRFQQEIEKLVNNDFFVKAQQFKHLA